MFNWGKNALDDVSGELSSVVGFDGFDGLLSSSPESSQNPLRFLAVSLLLVDVDEVDAENGFQQLLAFEGDGSFLKGPGRKTKEVRRGIDKALNVSVFHCWDGGSTRVRFATWKYAGGD
ncbi:hypothetical protein L596_021236 [Steinernema carpocapsae]|uniref:Uncharacterized protein n=1 Tax=Steinernema carpocapsae TaxID=34508 RepID=A0A4U5MVY7_STECR|nr:hypothetical protein L596_021236 [Steinernema carpocapsae]